MAKALCVEIGGTRIKWTILEHAKGMVADWQGPVVRTTRSLGWLNKTLPQLFDRSEWAGIAGREADFKSVDDICVGVCSPVDASGVVGGQLERLGAPVRMKDELTTRWPGKCINFVNDAEACFRGFRRFKEFVERDRKAKDCFQSPDSFREWITDVQPPFLILTCGTGIGVVASNTAGGIVSSEFYPPFQASELGAASGRAGVDPHEALGRGFFDWVAGHHQDWSYHDLRSAYTSRIAALVRDCATAWGRPKTVVLGGGNAEYISLRSLKGKVGSGVKVLALRRPELTIDPDLVNLVGTL